MFHDSHVFCLQSSYCSWLYCLWYASEILLIVPRISHYRWLSPNFGWFSSIYMWYMVGSQLSQLVVGQDVNMLYTLLVVSDIADSGSHGRKRWLDDGIDRKNHSVILQYWNPVKLPKGILLNLIIVVLLLYYAKIIPCFVPTKPRLYVQELATGGAGHGRSCFWQRRLSVQVWKDKEFHWDMFWSQI